MIRNCWGSIRWDDRSLRYQAGERYYTACKCCLSIKVKLLVINRGKSAALEPRLAHSCRCLSRQFFRFPQQFAGTHLCTWVERGTVRVECLAQEHNTMSPARTRTRTARSGVERTNHEATAIHINRDSSMVFSIIVLLHKYNFYPRNIFGCRSSKNSLGWGFAYFATCFVGI